MTDSMEQLLVYREDQLAKMRKRYFQNLVVERPIIPAAEVTESHTTSLTEDTDALTLKEPEGEFIDEGPLPPEELNALNQSIASFNPRPLHHGTPISPKPEYTVTHTPTNPTTSHRTVLIPNITPSTDPTTLFPQIIRQGIFFRMLVAQTAGMKVKGRDGKARMFGKNTVMIFFEEAGLAREFVGVWGAMGAVLVTSATNGRY